MPTFTDYSFTRYLAAKKSLDDRSLNRHVWEELARALGELQGEGPLRVLEVGCGIGTMLERLLDAGLLVNAAYTAMDAQAEHIATAQKRLRVYAAEKGTEIHQEEEHLLFQSQTQRVLVKLEAMDLFAFIPREQGRTTWDLLMAHAFLDLMDLPTTIPLLFSLLKKGGVFYATLNFDGATILRPEVEPELDRQIEALYHRTMDERRSRGQGGGSSVTGRQLFALLKAAGAEVLAAGSSDWVVFPGKTGYVADEAYFLHFIIHTIHQALKDHPLLEARRFKRWIDQRHRQIQRRELIYIAHQLDFLAIAGTGP